MSTPGRSIVDSMEDSTVALRRARQARLRDQRGSQRLASMATADLVQKPIRPLTDVAYNRMLQEWDVFVPRSPHQSKHG